MAFPGLVFLVRAVVVALVRRELFWLPLNRHAIQLVSFHGQEDKVF